jgi:hypothetical protein
VPSNPTVTARRANLGELHKERRPSRHVLRTCGFLPQPSETQKEVTSALRTDSASRSGVLITPTQMENPSPRPLKRLPPRSLGWVACGHTAARSLLPSASYRCCDLRKLFSKQACSYVEAWNSVAKRNPVWKTVRGDVVASLIFC